MSSAPQLKPQFGRSHFGTAKRQVAGSFDAAMTSDKTPDAGSNVRQLRRYQRLKVTIRALLHLRDQFQTTTIRDISVGGACLQGAFSVVPGDHIVLELSNGRKLPAEVRWWACGRSGIAFTSKLEESDPLMVQAKTGRRLP